MTYSQSVPSNNILEKTEWPGVSEASDRNVTVLSRRKTVKIKGRPLASSWHKGSGLFLSCPFLHPYLTQASSCMQGLAIENADVGKRHSFQEILATVGGREGRLPQHIVLI